MAQSPYWIDRASQVGSWATSAEGQTVELKEQPYPKAQKSKSEFLKDVSAFANATGGSILIGVREGIAGQPNSIIGLEGVESEIERLDAWATTSITPRIEGLEVFAETVFERTLIVIQVPEGSAKPHGFSQDQGDQFYIRVGKTCQRMNRSQLEDCFKQPKRDSRRVLAQAIRGEFDIAAREFLDCQCFYAQGQGACEQVEGIRLMRHPKNRPAAYITVRRKEPSITAYDEVANKDMKWREGHWVCLDEGLKPQCIRSPGIHGTLVIAGEDLRGVDVFQSLCERATLVANDCVDFGVKAMPHSSDLDWHDSHGLWYSLLVEEEIHRTKTYGLIAKFRRGRFSEFDPEVDPFYIEFKMNPFQLSAFLLDQLIAWMV